MWQQIKEWLWGSVFWLYESVAFIALVSRQYALSILCGVIIPAIEIGVSWFKNQQKTPRGEGKTEIGEPEQPEMGPSGISVGDAVKIYRPARVGCKACIVKAEPEVWVVQALWWANSCEYLSSGRIARPGQLCVHLTKYFGDGLTGCLFMRYVEFLLWRAGDVGKLRAAGLLAMPGLWQGFKEYFQKINS
ncbi:MAG: hypothetical protein COV85_04340 [Candidatus Portnoybacteria bacterium CG11_big_fil_rev_8_21_14_0_20_44_10]|uniref:Uncharacterized protein n=2 Tax=Candidatus Portnoyibacteriota TaxID=1817913 RepID=A0A2H0KPE0_9BACT|nr:MAG: hypothetical protein COV85_04340 [Candidatus Portnoybacteria bacterium CG11_big_fil_rev_8_21_14_0_20_44_10]